MEAQSGKVNAPKVINKSPAGAKAALANVEQAINLNVARSLLGATGAALDGHGLTVVVIDSGLRVSHVDFGGPGKVPRQLNLFSQGVRERAPDMMGHGTHVAGIIAANGIHKGIAYRAKVIPIRVLDDKGNLQKDDLLLEALNWVLDNSAAPGENGYKVSTVNISISSIELETNDRYGVGTVRSKIKTAIADLRARRIAVVCAAGNHYQAQNDAKAGKSLAPGMGFPAIVAETISVGATFSRTNLDGVFLAEYGGRVHSVVADQIAPFSNRLHESMNLRCRTDVFAPGGGKLASTGHTSDKAESRFTIGGTSQSAPVVTGLILLMQQAYQKETGELPTVDELEDWLRKGKVIRDGDDECDNVRHTCERYVRADARLALSACLEAATVQSARAE